MPGTAIGSRDRAVPKGSIERGSRSAALTVIAGAKGKVKRWGSYENCDKLAQHERS